LGNDRAILTGVSLTPVDRAGLAANDKRNWFNPAAFGINPLGTFGTLGRNTYYGPPLRSWDMGAFKEFRITEKINTQFRAEFFNIFNQANFDNPVTSSLNNATSFATVGAGGFGTITRTNPGGGDPRIIQFGLKLAF